VSQLPVDSAAEANTASEALPTQGAQDPSATRSPGMHMLHGSAWMIALRWAVRLIGVVSTVILARLLTPADFGVVAIAMIVVGLFEMLNMTGQGLAIIRHKNPTREHYDSAWTVSVVIGLFIATCILIAAPLTKVYFHEQRAIIVMQCLALRAVLAGMENIGTVDFRRDLRFDRFFVYQIVTKLLQFTVTVVLAVTLRTYWALVGGILIGQLARTIVSYIVHPFRPRISFAKMGEIWSFSIWTFARGVAGYLQTQVDNIAIGGIAGATSMGRYTVAKDVASSPTTEITGPVIAALFPVMAKYRSDPAQLRTLYLRTMGWMAIITTSTGVGVMLVAQDMVSVILGSKWTSITPLMGWLALDVGVAALIGGTYTVLDVLGLPYIGARMQWIRFVLLTAAVFTVAYLSRDLVAIAMTRFAVSALFVPSVLLAVVSRTGVTARQYVAVLWRPFASAALMALAVSSCNALVPFTGPLRLALDILVGATSYAASLLALWEISGHPPTAERDIIGIFDRIQSKFGRAHALPETAD
jgi:O-antigen/teichoic acid export membrane protein